MTQPKPEVGKKYKINDANVCQLAEENLEAYIFSHLPPAFNRDKRFTIFKKEMQKYTIEEHIEESMKEEVKLII